MTESDDCLRESDAFVNQLDRTKIAATWTYFSISRCTVNRRFVPVRPPHHPTSHRPLPPSLAFFLERFSMDN